MQKSAKLCTYPPTMAFMDVVSPSDGEIRWNW